MASGIFSPNKVSQQRPRPGAGGRPPIDGPRGGYGGGGGGRGGGDGAPDYYERLQRYRLGVAVGLVSILTVFFCMAAAYILREGFSSYDPTSGSYIRDWQPIRLPMALLWVNTALLLASSVTLEFARRQSVRLAALAPAWRIPGIARDERIFPWLQLTISLGLGFVAGQVGAWVVIHKALLAANVSTSFFYILTGTHAAHVIGGLVALLYALKLAWKNKPYEQRRVVVDVTSWYWHVIGAVWVCLLAMLILVR
jgi:cytochrome c oxidase subunit III